MEGPQGPACCCSRPIGLQPDAAARHDSKRPGSSKQNDSAIENQQNPKVSLSCRLSLSQRLGVVSSHILSPATEQLVTAEIEQAPKGIVGNPFSCGPLQCTLVGIYHVSISNPG